MTSIIREWISANFPLIYFVYGLAFFVLGLSIALQSRQYSRLNLARSLSWLAAFGFLHGLNEWGDVFIPIQGQFLSEATVMVLHSIHYIVLSLSFGFLFQFGIELFRPLRFKWIRWIPTAVFVIWLVVPYFIGFQLIGEFHRWSGFVTSIARYGLCLPGAIISGFGMLKQARTQVDEFEIPRINRMMVLAAWAFFAYAFFSGFIVNPSFYIPASIVNFDTFTLFLILPPAIFRAAIGAILALAIIRILEVFNIETERLIRRMEEREVLVNERERIARDIHDGALQQVYAAGLMAQSIQKRRKNPREDYERLISTINQAIDQLRAFLPQLRPEPSTLELIPALESVIEDARHTMRVKTLWETPESPVLSPEQISHLIAFTSEALSNAIRHSHTDVVEVKLTCVHGVLQFSVRDFGHGFPQNIDEGYGLRNMRDRARLLGASLEIKSNPGKGTTVVLDIPLEGLNAENPTLDC